ncbi:MAG: YhcH/YjgK/YiaL family protein [Succinivibrionaceae bacterium]|nr:YhcH/YjgK/YiaL family protein [Succinivibrionaceae bacterium]
MIIDTLKNIGKYEALLPGLGNGLKAVAALGPRPEPQRVEFDGGFLFVQHGSLRPMEDGTYEAHRKRIDVQIILEGFECIAWEDLSALKVTVPYNPEKDREDLEGPCAHTMRIDAGMAWAAFPQDAHKACRHLGAGGDFIKVVMKLNVEGA